MTKVVLVLDINENEVNKDAVKYVIGESFSPEHVMIEDVQDYPFKGFFRTDYLNIFSELKDCIANNYSKKVFTQDELIKLTLQIAEETSEGAVAEEFNNIITDKVNTFLNNKNIKGN